MSQIPESLLNDEKCQGQDRRPSWEGERGDKGLSLPTVQNCSEIIILNTHTHNASFIVRCKTNRVKKDDQKEIKIY